MKFEMPILFMRSVIFGFSLPGRESPARSPLTSAMNTGTPIILKFSARTWSVTVLPVPVAPEIRPCLFAISGSIRSSCSPFAANIGSFMPL